MAADNEPVVGESLIRNEPQLELEPISTAVIVPLLFPRPPPYLKTYLDSLSPKELFNILAKQHTPGCRTDHLRESLCQDGGPPDPLTSFGALRLHAAGEAVFWQEECDEVHSPDWYPAHIAATQQPATLLHPGPTTVGSTSLTENALNVLDPYDRSDDARSKVRRDGRAIQRPNSYIPERALSPRVSRSGRRTVLEERTKPGSSDLVAPGYLIDSFENAFVDTCAGNFISVEYLRQHGLVTTIAHTKRMVHRADGSSFSTEGVACLPWMFNNEHRTHMVDFDVLASKYCNHAITLGGKFLSTTRTLTDFADRLVRKLRTTLTPRVSFQGGGQLRMVGSCVGRQTAALPDTGSDISLMSPTFASDLELDIDTSKKHRVIVELPGGRYVRTQGLVRHVEWRFGVRSAFEDRHFLDFHIMDGLPSEVLLDCDFLLNTNAFGEHEDSLIELDYDEFDGIHDLFCNVRLVEKTKGLLHRLKNKLSDAESPEADAQATGIDATTSLLDEVEMILKSNRTQQEKEAVIEVIKDRWLRVHPRGPGARPSNTSPC
ncbi:unnamed protein product [Zymoseptoria tritici ST99CH_3D7]|uniref:Uncharacterized protein n=1 Tax=Zymoseptoria tritici (strain ST99CH_3D7) TaxID=1276538 RepID=A0A1X7RKS1_ZYMT9|nr:unnamed protein product [Zymoseptoria tritici ST99CH_3D7]